MHTLIRIPALLTLLAAPVAFSLPIKSMSEAKTFQQTNALGMTARVVFTLGKGEVDNNGVPRVLALAGGKPIVAWSAGAMCLTDRVVLFRRPLLLRTPAEIAQISTMPDDPVEPTASWLGVPILQGDDVLGILNVQSFQPNAFDEDDQRFLTMVASLLAQAARRRVEHRGAPGEAVARGRALPAQQLLQALHDSGHIQLIATEVDHAVLALVAAAAMADGDAALSAEVARLRAAGEVVIELLPGESIPEGPRCTRRLVANGGSYNF